MLDLRNVSFSYGKKAVLEFFNLEVADGEIVALMGPSGCGKTTVLRLAAGLERPNRGGVIVSSAKRISAVFQEPRLLPHLTVRRNLSVVLENGRARTEEIDAMLARVGLSDAAQLYPDELSGGMKSRVALARAMLYGGELYLLDEPFAALDEALSASLGKLLREHIKATGASAILVTHRTEDALQIADRTVQLAPL